MKIQLVFKISIASLFMGSLPTTLYSREITASEIASFLDISSWETKVSLPTTTYSIEICPIENGRIGPSLFGSGTDLAWVKDGHYIIFAGPTDGKYKLSVTSKSGGGYGVSTQIPLFQAVYRPALPDIVSEGVYILFVDLADRDLKGAQNDPASYKRGFVLKVTKEG